MISEHDLYLLGEGTFERTWERLGAHVVEEDGRRGVRFAVWAPNAARVSVVGEHNAWDPTTHPMARRGATGFWEAFIPDVGAGLVYKYWIDGAHGAVFKADPQAFWSEAPPGTASVVYELSGYEWGDAAWLAARPERQRHDQPLSSFEVHAGSWRRHADGRPLTYRELAAQLVPYVKEMGFTHIELMPITEYPADQSWGYQVTGYFAPTARYGGPHDLMSLVDACHRAGIGVILDWVPAHFANEEHGLRLLDGTYLYEHADPTLRESPWGSSIFNYGRAEVRNFLLSSARFWLDVYHVDGFRVDAVAFMVWLDHARPESHWGLNRLGGRENLEAVEFLKSFNAAVHGDAPGAITLAEEATSYNWVTTLGGRREDSQPGASLGFDYKWNMGWMHDTLDYFAVEPVGRKQEHQLLTFPIWYAFDERYVLPLSHDEVVHLKKALLTKMPPQDGTDDWQRFANLRALLAYQYAHPGKKLLFMGGELGQWAEWDETRALDWWLLEWSGPAGKHAPLHRGLQRCVADLNRLHREEPALHALDSHPRGFDWIDHQDYESSVVSFVRRGPEPGQTLAVVCNFTPVVRERYPLGVPVPGVWHEALNTDWEAYGGGGVRVERGGTAEAAHRAPEGRRHGGVRYGQRLLLTLPPLAVVYLRPGAAPG